MHGIAKDLAITQESYPLARMMTAGFDAWRLSLRIGETMIASQAVIGARMTMLGNAIGHPARMPYAELGRLVPEKAAAFGKAQAGASRAMTAKRTPPASLPGALIDDGLAMLDWWERSIEVASAWWLPVHAQATANAKRLGARRR